MSQWGDDNERALRAAREAVSILEAQKSRALGAHGATASDAMAPPPAMLGHEPPPVPAAVAPAPGPAPTPPLAASSATEATASCAIAWETTRPAVVVRLRES